MYNYLLPRFPRAPPIRRWRDRQQMQQEVLTTLRVSNLIALEGDLHGPRLRQGMLVLQGGHLLFILEEFGRLPTRDNLITTLSIAINSGVTFPLFIPIAHIDTQEFSEELANFQFQETVPFLRLMSTHQRILSNPPPTNPV